MRKAFFLLLICLFLASLFPPVETTLGNDIPYPSIRVVLDDDYPPYIFRDAQGKLQGILVDEWNLWEKKTGTRVTLTAMDWAKAQQYFREGRADVIDTIFFTEERSKLYEFSKPYARLDVPVFFHKNLSGIADLSSLQGFTIGVKAGDACIEVFRRHGLTSLKEYNSYEAVVRAAAEGRIKVFSVDEPPALYYLYKMNLEDEFRYAFTLYTGEFHRAVLKSRTDLLPWVEQGFSLITPEEHKAIEKKWLGKPILKPIYIRYALIFLSVITVVIIALIAFNLALRSKVRLKTKELEDLVTRLQLSEEKFRLIAENTADIISHLDLNLRFVYVSPSIVRILGYTVDEAMTLSLEGILPAPSLKKVLQVLEAEMNIEATGTADPNRSHMLELEVYKKDRSLVWIENNLSFLRDGTGRPSGILAVSRDITERKETDQRIRNSLEKLRKAMGGIIQAMAETVEIRDPFTAGHQRRVADLARSIAQEMGLDQDRVESIRLAGVIHDLGKISVPAEILSKPAQLNDLEFRLIQMHPQIGYDILKHIDFPWPLAQIVYQHHERMDGSGYPRGLSGEAVCLEARILAVADVVEAITSHRPYRPGQGIDMALEEISNNKGTLYDPSVVDACLKLFREKGYHFK